MDARTQGEIRQHLEGRIARLREQSRQLEDQLERVEAVEVRDSADKAVAAKQDELLGRSVHSNRAARAARTEPEMEPEEGGPHP